MKVFAGLALVGLIVVGCPLDAVSGAVEVPIELKVVRSKCLASIDPARTVSYTNHDVLVFSFANYCPQAQQVFVCVNATKTKTTYAEPWDVCKGLPKLPPPMVGKQFGIGAATGSRPATANVLCSVRWPNAAGKFETEKFALQAFNAATGTVVCPRSAKEAAAIPGSELALEVDP